MKEDLLKMKWLKLNGNGGLINLEEVFFVRIMRNEVFMCASRGQA